MSDAIFYWTGIAVFVCSGIAVLCGLVTVACNELWIAAKKAYTMGELQIAMRRYGNEAKAHERKRLEEEAADSAAPTQPTGEAK